MRIAVINETSAGDKNVDIMAALEGTGHEILNVGMKQKGGDPELSYIHTGFLTGLLINAARADFVIGGCGTGQGYLNSAMQYPDVFCGHIMTDLDAWLFAQINGGNCISLALAQGYGWAGNENIRFIVERLFSVERGGGYPPHRREPQRQFRRELEDVSAVVHKPFARIVRDLPAETVRHALRFPGVLQVLDIGSLEDSELKQALQTVLA
ncbi:MAG: ribose-5-phosphate isomerase [Spirochaetaceae bacterium]|nr:MAG: ribose-5-phosphate isomerase [Spirochaetaceae bacterium]